jgi:hypothetical protein
MSVRDYIPEPLVVRPKAAKILLNCGDETLWGYINSGEVDSYKDGAARKITVASIHALIRRRVEEAKPAEPTKSPETISPNPAKLSPEPKRRGRPRQAAEYGRRDA